MTKGRLRLYLGAASGVGTTYAMLDEAQRRRNRGTDVMIGWVDTHSRRFTSALLSEVAGGDPVPSMLDPGAIIERRPEVAMIDELGRHEPDATLFSFHWEAVEKILDAGIDVVGTVNIQHFASLAPQVASIMGTAPCSCIPERFLQRAEQIELVDITTEAIRRRIAHGNVFTPTELQPNEAELFNSEAFTRLRSLALTWLSDRLNGELAPTDDERVVVVVDENTAGEALSRASRISQRTGAELLGLHVVTPRDDADPGARSRRRKAVEDAGGRYHEITGRDVPTAVFSFASNEGAAHIVVEPSARRTVFPGAQKLEAILPHSGVSKRRRAVAFTIAAFGLAVLTTLLVANRNTLSVPTSLALYLLCVVGITAIGGLWPGLAAAVVSPFIANWYLIPPYHTFRINDGENILELVVFVSAATIVSTFVAIASRRAREAETARRESTLLSTLGSTTLAQPMSGIMNLLVETFRLSGATVMRESAGVPTEVSRAGSVPPLSQGDSTFATEISPGYTLLVSGPTFSSDDLRVLSAFVGYLALVIEQQNLRDIATEAEALAKADDLRNSILRAVSHDLRSPLAGIKASVSSLRQTDVDWPDAVRNDFLAAIESDTDRLTAIITNLLDLSRIDSGVLTPSLRPVAVEDIIPAALRSLTEPENVVVSCDDDLPEFVADPALLERVVANLVGNAVTWSPQDTKVLVQAFVHEGEMHVHIVDHGRGIPESAKKTVTQPFHRLDDSNTAGGLGLGLAIADRLTTSMNGRLELRDTPGGGLTAAVILPCEGAPT